MVNAKSNLSGFLLPSLGQGNLSHLLSVVYAVSLLAWQMWPCLLILDRGPGWAARPPAFLDLAELCLLEALRMIR